MTTSFIPARWFRVASRTQIDWIILHSMEDNEAKDSAEATARFFSKETDRKTSAHECVDNDSVVLCVAAKDVAYQCGPTGNSRGYGIEQAGKAMQSRADWLDAYGRQMLPHVGQRIYTISKQYNIPLTYVNAEGLKRGDRGVTTHNEIRLAFGETTHTDPGAGYPIDVVLDHARQYANPQTKEAAMALVKVPVDAVSCPTGGGWILGRDGSVVPYRGAPNWGSYATLRPEQRLGSRAFVAIELKEFRKGLRKYWGFKLIGDDGTEYDFGPK